MGSQIQKVAVEGAVLAGQYLCHYCLQVVVDALPATASEVLKGTNVGIKYHLKAFTGVRQHRTASGYTTAGSGLP